ncbi:hypothetical protein [Xanthomarina sp.]|uniref:hypothetical protein n=1 Tax=Xanthomarina sp. TaxID=1931211 RepID=UPI002C39564D|nr:hypothetical protein [Xanthomarina sp.]HLV40544.1 hypothetical protein [Xanthomarina sp.]
MKKFIYTIFLFTLFASIFYVLALFVFGSSYRLSKLEPNINYKLGAYGHMNTRLKEIKNVQDIDILFLGSSHCYRGFDTRIFKNNGLKTFNLGSSAQTPIQTEALLKRYLEKVSPKTVIYEVFPSTLISDGVESSLDLVSNDKNDIYSIQMATRTNHILTYNTLIYATIRELLKLNNSFKEPLKKGKDIYIPGGYIEKEVSYYKPNKINNKALNLNEKQLDAFKRNIELIKKKEINLILVFAPITKNQYSSYTNPKYYDSLMNTYGKYYNFNEMMNLNDTQHFYDNHHLNQKGVNLFNEKVLSTINLKSLD